MHQASVAAVRLGQNLGDRVPLAMWLNRQE